MSHHRSYTHHQQKQQAHSARYVTLHTQTILLCHTCLRAIAVTCSPVSPSSSSSQQQAPKQNDEIYQRFLRITFCAVCRDDEQIRHNHSRQHRHDTDNEDPICRERTHDGLVIPFSPRLQNAVKRITDVLGIREPDICVVGGSSGVVVMCVERCMEGVGDSARARLVLAAAGASIAGAEAEVRRFCKVASGKDERGRRGKEGGRREGSAFEYGYEDDYEFWGSGASEGRSGRHGGDNVSGGHGRKTEYFYEDEYER